MSTEEIVERYCDIVSIDHEAIIDCNGNTALILVKTNCCSEVVEKIEALLK